jgi:hypothetical protein
MLAAPPLREARAKSFFGHGVPHMKPSSATVVALAWLAAMLALSAARALGAADGNAVTAKSMGRTAGATPKDIRLLKLETTSHRGSGWLTGVTTIQRLNTQGGVAEESGRSRGDTSVGALCGRLAAEPSL